MNASVVVETNIPVVCLELVEESTVLLANKSNLLS